MTRHSSNTISRELGAGCGVRMTQILTGECAKKHACAITITYMKQWIEWDRSLPSFGIPHMDYTDEWESIRTNMIWDNRPPVSFLYIYLSIWHCCLVIECRTLDGTIPDNGLVIHRWESRPEIYTRHGSAQRQSILNGWIWANDMGFCCIRNVSFNWMRYVTMDFDRIKFPCPSGFTFVR